MKIDILQLLDGAKTIYAVGDIDQAYALKRLHPDCVLAGSAAAQSVPALMWAIPPRS